MSYDMKLPLAPHRVVLEDRNRLAVSGVEEVESFDESVIVLHTGHGMMVVRGTGLHIEQLSLDGGDLKVDGEVESISYEEDNRRGAGFFARLLR